MNHKYFIGWEDIYFWHDVDELCKDMYCILNKDGQFLIFN